MTTLRSFLESRRVDGVDWNITGINEFDKGKYLVKDEEYDKFLTLAYESIFKNKKACSLLERHRDYGPLLIDLDFRYEADGGPLRRRFNDDHIIGFVMDYITELCKFVDITKLEKDLNFHVMCKPSAEHDGKRHKDGIHIQCPDITTDPKLQFVLRGSLLQKKVIENVFGDTKIVNDCYDCFDVSVIHRNNWFLYGACKPNKAQYKICKIITVPQKILTDISIDKISEVIETGLEECEIPEDSLDIMKYLSIRRNHTEMSDIVIRPEMMEEYNKLLAIWGKGSAKPTKVDTISHLPKKVVGGAGIDHDDDTTVVSLIGDTGHGGHSHEEVILAYRLVKECLDPEKRCGEYHDWINLGICLKNIANNPESMAVWAEITRRVDKTHKKASYTDAQILAKWNLLKLTDREKQLRMGSLHYWAKEDNYDIYQSILGESIIEWIIHFASDTHLSVAKLVKKLYQHEFRCSTAGKRGPVEWFMFVGHSWIPLKKNSPLRIRLGEEVRNYYIQADRYLGDLIIRSRDTEKEVHENKRKLIINIEKKLEDTHFRDNVMKECESLYYDDKFIEKLNMNPRLVGCSNGVLELRYYENDELVGKPKVLFRPGRPDDLISFQVGKSLDLDSIPYVPYDPENPNKYHKFVLDFYEKVYPDEVLRQYVLTLDAACLEGINSEQKIYFETGSGSNGKSMKQILKSCTLGDYAASIEPTVLTRKRADPGAANPELIVLKGIRYIYGGEPEDNEKINAARMKQLSGGDAVRARALHTDQDLIKIMGRIFIACNDLPPITTMDGGTWRRPRVINHIAKFVDHDIEENPEEHIHHKDYDLEEKFKSVDMRIAYLGILVHYFENYYLNGGLKEPDSVKTASETYKHENDIFSGFIEDTFIKEIGAGPIRIVDIMSKFNTWKRTMPGASDIKKAQIIDRIKSISAKGSSDKEFYGIRFKDTDD